jgi:membrane-bound serine protease (ClpP class)
MLAMVRWIVLALLLAAPTATSEPNSGPFLKIAVISLRDESDQHIDTSVKTSVLRRIEQAKDAGADCVIFDIDSYGGLVSASMETGQEILDLGSSVHTIAYVHRKVISGGAMISLACQEIVMSEVATIGDSQAVYAGSDGEMKIAPEKIQTTVAAEFRKYAERNGYPIPLCEAMVRQEMAVWRYRPGDDKPWMYLRQDWPDDETGDAPIRDGQELEIVVRKGELATFTAKEAREHSLASKLHPNLDSLLTELKAPEGIVVQLGWTRSENVSRWLLGIRPLLFLLGIVAGYIAFKTPGTGVPEALALLFFGLYFGASSIAGLAETWEILIFIAGVALIAVELFVLPGFGVPGFAGLALVLISLALVTLPSGPVNLDPATPRLIDLAIDFLSGAFGATIIAFFLAKYLPKLPFFGRLALGTPEPGSAMASHAVTRTDPLVGRRGIAISDLRPAGIAQIDGGERDVVADSGYVASGHAVQVVDVRGAIVVVRALPENA